MFAHQLCWLLCDQFQLMPKRLPLPGWHCPRAVRRRVLFARNTRGFQLYNYVFESMENVFEKEFVPRLSVRHSISTMLTVVVRAPISKSRSPGRALKGEGQFSLTCASNGNFSGQGSCSKVVCDVTSAENATVTSHIDLGESFMVPFTKPCAIQVKCFRMDPSLFYSNVVSVGQRLKCQSATPSFVTCPK